MRLLFESFIWNKPVFVIDVRLTVETEGRDKEDRLMLLDMWNWKISDRLQNCVLCGEISWSFWDYSHWFMIVWQSTIIEYWNQSLLVCCEVVEMLWALANYLSFSGKHWVGNGLVTFYTVESTFETPLYGVLKWGVLLISEVFFTLL